MNNSKSKTLGVTSSSYSWKHPGSTASGGFGINTGTISFAAKFTTTSAKMITDAKLEFSTPTGYPRIK